MLVSAAASLSWRARQAVSWPARWASVVRVVQPSTLHLRARKGGRASASRSADEQRERGDALVACAGARVLAHAAADARPAAGLAAAVGPAARAEEDGRRALGVVLRLAVERVHLVALRAADVASDALLQQVESARSARKGTARGTDAPRGGGWRQRRQPTRPRCSPACRTGTCERRVLRSQHGVQQEGHEREGGGTEDAPIALDESLEPRRHLELALDDLAARRALHDPASTGEVAGALLAQRVLARAGDDRRVGGLEAHGAVQVVGELGREAVEVLAHGGCELLLRAVEEKISLLQRAGQGKERTGRTCDVA